jgi:hypothetical protein
VTLNPTCFHLGRLNNIINNKCHKFTWTDCQNLTRIVNQDFPAIREIVATDNFKSKLKKIEKHYIFCFLIKCAVLVIYGYVLRHFNI